MRSQAPDIIVAFEHETGLAAVCFDLPSARRIGRACRIDAYDHGDEFSLGQCVFQDISRRGSEDVETRGPVDVPANAPLDAP